MLITVLEVFVKATIKVNIHITYLYFSWLCSGGMAVPSSPLPPQYLQIVPRSKRWPCELTLEGVQPCLTLDQFRQLLIQWTLGLNLTNRQFAIPSSLLGFVQERKKRRSRTCKLRRRRTTKMKHHRFSKHLDPSFVACSFKVNMIVIKN